MCNCSDYERPSVYQDVARKARKRHRCGECRGLIEPGTFYHETRGLWEGQWSTQKTCGSCWVVAHTLLDCYSFGDLIECLNDDLGFRYRPTGARGAYAAMLRRRRAAERILKST